MFAIAQQQNQYLTYILTDREAGSSLEVVPERGGLITRWRVGDRDLLYLDENRFADPTLSVRGGIPLLFPICGNLPENTYTHADKQYSLKQHGFARDLPWEVEEQSTDKSASITLKLSSNEQTRAVYPFEFVLTFTYQIKGNLLKINQNFTNLSAEDMPFSFGLHPYFIARDKTQLDLEIPGDRYLDQITKEINSFSGAFDFDLDEIDAAFVGVNKHSTAIGDRDLGSKIVISYSQPYSTVVFWTVKGKDYACLEPWTAPRNALNTGEKLVHLAPKNTLQAVVELSYQKIPENF